MEDLLIVRDLYKPIYRENIPTRVIESEWKTLNRKVVATIRQSVDTNALNKTSLMRKIVRLKYRDGESIMVLINTLMGLVNQLAAAKSPLDDVMHALLLLCTLPDSWENLVLSLNTSCQEDNLSLQVVKTSILNEETRWKDKGIMSQSEANVAQHSDRGRSK